MVHNLSVLRMRSELNEEAPAFQCVASKESCWSHRRLLMMRRRFLCQFAVCMLLIEACEALSVISCLVPKDDASGSDRLCGKKIVKVRSYNFPSDNLAIFINK